MTFLASSKNVKISLKLSVEDGEGEDSCFRLQHNLKAEWERPHTGSFPVPLQPSWLTSLS